MWRHLGVYKTKEEAIRELGPDIEWYDPDYPDRPKGTKFGKGCFYCSYIKYGYVVTEGNTGILTGKIVCERHFDEFANKIKSRK